jgi:hypothetical protein
VQLYPYFVSQSIEFCSHNPLCCFWTSVYCCERILRYRLSPETFGYPLVQCWQTPLFSWSSQLCLLQTQCKSLPTGRNQNWYETQIITWHHVTFYSFVFESFKEVKLGYMRVSRSFRTGLLERELQMVELSATRCSCIATLWVSLVSFAAINICVASQRVFIVVVVYFVTTQSGNFWIHPLILGINFLPVPSPIRTDFPR